MENSTYEVREGHGRITLRWVLYRQVVTVGGGWNSFRILCNGWRSC